jgi:hypothetical protein
VRREEKVEPTSRACGRRALLGVGLCLIVAAGFASTACAQDAHYWSQHYATRGVLLGGSVIGSADDLGATFYNPGLMGWVNTRELVLGSNVYEYTSLRSKGLNETDVSLESRRLSLLPNLVAGQFGWEVFGGQIAYSLLTRQAVRVSAQLRLVEPGPPTGADLRTGEYIFDQDLSEVWAGATWARLVSDGWGIGVTPYVAFRNQKFREHVLAQVVDPAGSVSTAGLIRDVSYSHVRLLAKAGLGYRADEWSFGMTATTPGLRVYGSGQAFLNAAVSNLDIDQDPGADDFLASQLQSDTAVRYRAPWSVGAGGSATFGPTTVHVSAEWFSAVDEYDFMDLQPFQSQSGGETIDPMLQQGLKSIVNWGLGLEVAVSDERRLYASLVSDRSAKGDRSEASALFSSWDILHATVGSNVDVGIANLTLGFSYGWGSDSVRTSGGTTEFPNPANGVVLDDEFDLEFSRIRLLVGAQAEF